MEFKIVRLIDKPEIKEQIALWFHQKWIEKMSDKINRERSYKTTILGILEVPESLLILIKGM
ncbi:MAG: hypothetical protein K1V96_05590 [Lachnospiraceae bacterium]